MKRNTTKLVALLLALVLTLGLLAGCGGDSATPPANSGSTGNNEIMNINGLSLPLTQEKQELTVWLVYSGTVMTDLNEIEGVKKMEELTNVHINWIPVSLFEIADKYGILLAGGNLPDIVYPADWGYPGGVIKGVEDGIIYPDMDTLIHNYMPNYMAFLDSNEEARKEATEDNGKLVTAKSIVAADGVAQSEGTYVGLTYRADLLRKMGVDVPKSIDGWHDVLLKAKQDGICEYPFMLNLNGSSPFSESWGLATQSFDGLQQRDGKVEFCQALDEYQEYLDTMRQWYSEGLIDPNFTSFQFYLDTPNSVENNKNLVYSTGLSTFTGNSYYNMHMVTNADVDLQPLIPPPVHDGGTCNYQWGSRIIAKSVHYITTACKNPELAAKWLDFLYTDVGSNLIWYGIEGVTYEMGEDGTPHYTDFVLRNPDGTPAQDILQKYALGHGTCMIGQHNVAASWKLFSDLNGGESQEQKAVKIWSQPEINLYLTTCLSLTEEEGDEANRILTAIKTMVSEHTINYIIGTDNTDFETYRAGLYAAGLQTVLDIYQAAYDRYLTR